MSRNTAKPAARKGGSSLITGILVGMIIGVGLAAGLAWFIMKSPSPFVAKEQAASKAAPAASAAKPEAPAAVKGVAVAPVQAPASAVDGDKPRFEFYKVLTDKQEASVAPEKAADKPKVAEVKPKAASGPMFLQAGSFSNESDAEKLKARIAFMGSEASIQTVTIPDKGVWHRVRLGPYKNESDMNRVRNMLKQNGVDATPIHAQ